MIHFIETQIYFIDEFQKTCECETFFQYKLLGQHSPKQPVRLEKGPLFWRNAGIHKWGRLY